ncbi:MAG: hypothetical protein ABWY00_13855 [Dongiaceae bacterium]
MNHEDFLGFLVFGLSRGTVQPHRSRRIAETGEEFPAAETRVLAPDRQFGLQRVAAGFQHLFGKETEISQMIPSGLGRPTPRV